MSLQLLSLRSAVVLAIALAACSTTLPPSPTPIGGRGNIDNGRRTGDDSTSNPWH